MYSLTPAALVEFQRICLHYALCFTVLGFVFGLFLSSMFWSVLDAIQFPSRLRLFLVRFRHRRRRQRRQARALPMNP